MPPAKSSRAVIGDLHALNCRLVIRCKVCGHQAIFTPPEAVARFGWNCRVDDMRPRLACVRCGATGRAGQVAMGVDGEDSRTMERRGGLPDDHPEAMKDRSPGRRKTASHRMAWQGSLGQMLAAGTLVMASCEGCGKYRELDVAHLVDAFGPDTDLWDRWARCHHPGCGKRVFFIAFAGPSTPGRPCITSGNPNHWAPRPMEGLQFIREAAARS